MTVVAHADAEEAKSVGVGMTPGDESYPEPYLYVTPWPYPDAETLPGLALGTWHTTGWTGAVLRASEALNGGEDPERRVRAFLEGAVAACLGLVGEGV